MAIYKSVDPGITDPYTKRILSNLIGKNPFDVYGKTPIALRRLLKGLSRSGYYHTTPERQWSIAAIINHLCDAELVMAYRYRLTLAQPGTQIQAYDESQWAKNLKYESANPRKKLDLFLALRNDNIEIMKNLSDEEWQRFGIHQERGKETIERMMQMNAGHDVNHLKQIETLRKTARSKKKR